MFNPPFHSARPSQYQAAEVCRIPAHGGRPMSKRAAVYVRVSTADQHFENQLPALEKMAEGRGLEIVKTYSEKASAWAGDSLDRPELQQMLLDAHRGEFDVLLIWALDRLTRGGILESSTILHRLKSAGVELHSFQESWLAMGGPMGEMLVGIFSSLAKMESDRRSERVKAGMARAKAAGKNIGRRRDVVDEVTLANLYSEGYSKGKIAKMMGLSLSMVRRRLQRIGGDE